MKQEGVGRYKEFIDLLMKYINLFSHYGNVPFIGKSEIKLTAKQWQTLACIVEHEKEHKNMVFMANKIGLQKSTFSKYVTSLVDFGLVERFQHEDNGKDIVLKPSKKGLVFYKECGMIIWESGWKEPFLTLQSISDENLAIMVDFMKKMITEMEPKNNKVRKLFKLQ